MNKTTQTQRDNIRFALRWSDGYKLYGVKHVKGDAWSIPTDNIIRRSFPSILNSAENKRRLAMQELAMSLPTAHANTEHRRKVFARHSNSLITSVMQ